MHRQRNDVRKSCRSLVLLGAVIAICTGCGGSGDSPPLGRVSGVVTFDGRPVSPGRITFVPQSGGRTSTADLDEQGRYKLVYSLDEFGAKVGTHTVRVTTESDLGGRERIPENYNVKSELTADVQPGDNVFNFDLKNVPKTSKK